MDSFIGSGLGNVVPVCLLRCSMQRMIAIIRIVVMSNPTDAMRSSKIMVCVFVCLHPFFVDFPVSGVVRAKPQKVKLWCNVKFLDGMPPRPSQWNFPVRELVSGSRLV